ncbi:MAG: lipid-A-disaccharide synthase [Bacteroidetes bacterium]|nr:lipid-A-disaccharide synthase [Bacteroidota bacterium]MCL2302017.1 lipid-A-disaccharide synthase [Lentimicrobiaceae bacterium]
MKYYIIAGEASGDLLGSYLMKSIKKLDANADFRCWGGDLMEAQGGEIIKHYKDLAFMGFWEVLKNLRTILINIKVCKIDILLYEPDVLILIDYPGFNMRIAKFAKEQNIRVVYYVSPQIWAWKKKRMHKIKRDVDTLITILPFEKDFYAKYNYEAHYVGHPLLDVVTNEMKNDDWQDFKANYNLDDRPVIAILPGSRRQELKKMLPVMVQMVKQFPEYQFVMSKVKWQPLSLYQSYIKDKQIALVEGNTYSLLHHAKAAMVTSGTATLETALWNVPQVVCYKGSFISYLIARIVVGKHLKYISLVNLILDKPAVTELIQHDYNPKKLKTELEKIVHNHQIINTMKSDYEQLRHILGDAGASDNAAKLIVKHEIR